LDPVSLLIAVPLALVLLYLMVRLPLAIVGNLRAGHRFRQRLAASLEQLRLARMLGYLGIDRSTYLHEQPAVDIHRHMQRCADCDAKPTCDQVLDQEGPAEVEPLGFCANIEDLKTLRPSRSSGGREA
jgi:hypothetical protein